MNKEELYRKQHVRNGTVALRGAERRLHDTNAPSRKHKMARLRGKEASGKFSHAHHGSESPPAVHWMPCWLGVARPRTASHLKSISINEV